MRGLVPGPVNKAVTSGGALHARPAKQPAKLRLPGAPPTPPCLPVVAYVATPAVTCLAAGCRMQQADAGPGGQATCRRQLLVHPCLAPAACCSPDWLTEMVQHVVDTAEAVRHVVQHVKAHGDLMCTCCTRRAQRELPRGSQQRAQLTTWVQCPLERGWGGGGCVIYRLWHAARCMAADLQSPPSCCLPLPCSYQGIESRLPPVARLSSCSCAYDYCQRDATEVPGGMKVCGGCRVVHYCSQECQVGRAQATWQCGGAGGKRLRLLRFKMWPGVPHSCGDGSASVPLPTLLPAPSPRGLHAGCRLAPWAPPAVRRACRGVAQIAGLKASA